MFTGAFLILGADGIRPHHHVNESMFWTDFLAMVGAFGCCVSSALTLVVRRYSIVANNTWCSRAYRLDATL